jgi:hypothetical protein
MALSDPHSVSAEEGSPLTAERTTHAATAKRVAASPNQIQTALRIRAALRAAHEDIGGVRLPAGRWYEWTWKVKRFPRPPLMINRMEKLNSQELLANDSLGG